jgi:hypothetical protein
LNRHNLHWISAWIAILGMTQTANAATSTDGALVVSVDLDTDQIKLRRIDDPEALSGLSAWDTFELLQGYVGQELGWCWVGRNYRGYADTFVMSFAGIEPQIALVGAASTLLFYKMLKV